MSEFDFVFGESHSGKSEYIYKWLIGKAEANPGNKYFLIVPEQSTLRAQRQIVHLSKRHGMLNLDVLSFELLYHRVMEELGINHEKALDDMSKTFLLRKAVLDTKVDGELKAYGRVVLKRGFIEGIKSLFTEFYEYDINEAKLRSALEASESEKLKNKLRDIISIYSHFTRLLKGHPALREEHSQILLKHIDKSRLLTGAFIAFDGFNSFTAVQMKLLKSLIKKAELSRFVISLPEGSDPYSFNEEDFKDIWWFSKRLVSRIIDIARKAKVDKAHPGEHVMPGGGKLPRDISILRAENQIEEVRYVAKSIRLNARMHGIRYQRMAVITEDPDTYANIIKREFTKREIPFFLDEKKAGLESPFIDYLRSALNMILSDYQNNDVARFLKNPLIRRESPDESKLFEFDNFLKKTGSRGRKLMSHLATERPQSLKDLEGVFHLEDNLIREKTIRGKVDSIRLFINDCSLKERMASYIYLLSKEGHEKEALLNERFLNLSDSLLSKLTEFLGDESTDTDEFVRFLDTSFSDLRGGMIPETMDMVTVGDLRRSRLDETDILYILGVNEGHFPALNHHFGIFTEAERLDLKKTGKELPENLSFELDFNETLEYLNADFYIHSSVLKPKKELVVTFSSGGIDAKGLRPAALIEDLKKEGALIKDADNLISSREDALAQFALSLESKEKKDEQEKIYFALRSDTESNPKLNRLLKSLFPKHFNEVLSDDIPALIYKNPNEASSSRLEDFEKCPYSHFLKYGLGLLERENFDLDPRDIGNLYHKSLKLVWSRISGDAIKSNDISCEELDNIIETALKETLNEIFESEHSLTARENYIAERTFKITERTIKMLDFQMRSGNMQTVGSEFPFRFKEGKYALRGSIDRLDMSQSVNGKTYIKIIDYKSGKTSFDLTLCKNGLLMQLPLYMLAAIDELQRLNGRRNLVYPAGMFYYNIKDPVLDYKEIKDKDDLKNSVKKLKEKELKMNGLVYYDEDALKSLDASLNLSQMADKKSTLNSSVFKNVADLSREEFIGLLDFCKKRFVLDMDKINEGEISIKPFKFNQKTGCDYCKFKGICAFDESNIKGYRIIKKDVLE